MLLIMKTRKIALGAIVSALSIVMMLLTSVLPVGTYALPCFAGILLIVVVVECGPFRALAVYFCVSVLSFLLVSDKEAALYYTLVLGIYPVLKSFFEGIRRRWLSFTVKLVYFNISALCAYYISIFLLAVPVESFSLFGVNLPFVFLILGNVVFIAYDMCLSRLVRIYLDVWRNRFKF